MVMRIRVEGQAAIAAQFKARPAQIKRAARKTVRQVTNKLHKRLGGAIPRADGTPVVGYRKIRAKKKTPRGRGRSSYGEVWMGTNKIAAHYAGRMRNRPSQGGASVGGHFFKNAFVAKMSNGYESVWKRIEGGKLEQQYVELPSARREAERAAKDAQVDLARLLRKNMEIEMNKGKK